MTETTVKPPRTGSIFLAVAMLASSLLAVVFIVHYMVEYHSEETRRKESELLNVSLARNALVEDITTITTDLAFLRTAFEELLEIPERDVSLQRAARLFLNFSRQKGLYDQIRFLDVSGSEVLRVNWSGSTAYLVAQAELQDKSTRYYFHQAMGMQAGQIYFSPFDLNVEDGQVELPVKPVIRVATRVFDPLGKAYGIVVLNYLGSRSLERFQLAAANIRDRIQLLNDQGYWLSSPRDDESWAFMFGRDTRFSKTYPQEWSLISGGQNGQFETAHGLFTFASVIPQHEVFHSIPQFSVNPEIGVHALKVVSHVSVEGDPLGLFNFVVRYISLYLGVLSLLLILAYLFAVSHVHRRRAEAQQAYEVKFRRTLENIDLLALMIDRDGRIVFCNPCFLRHGGWSREQIVGQSWMNILVPPDSRAQAARVFDGLDGRVENPQNNEYPIYLADGGQRLIAWNNTLSRGGEGEITGLTLIGEDVTEMRQAEDKIRQLSRAVEQSPASVMITNRHGLIEYVNLKFTRVTGYSFDEVVGKNPRFLKSGETPSEEYSQLWEALEAGGEWRGEFHNQRKDGALYWEAAVISALRDPDGEITHFLAVKEDITERKRLEQEVDSRNLELARSHALNSMGRMASMLAHDLSNPLSSVKMAVQLLGKQAENNDARELASISQEQILYMEGIIAEMLAYARPGELEVSWLNAEKLLNGVIGIVQRRIIDFGVEVSFDCASGLPTFPGDASKLRQLLSNLIVNALQATTARPPGERRVWIRVEQLMADQGRQIQFTVSDNGEGIDPEASQHIFEPFFTTRAKGTGLGLSIVKQISDLHGGHIELTANQPVGTRAVLSLPLIPAVSTRQQGQVNLGEKQRA